MEALVSIIVPVYNAEPYLDDCILSVLNQTVNEWELFLIDDGSNDNSGLICQRYVSRDERIKYFRKENTGVSATRNFALDLIQTPYFCFLDSDDSLEPDYLEKLLFFRRYDIIVGGYNVKYINKKTKSIIVHCPPKLVIDDINATNKHLMIPLFKEGYIHSSCNKLFKTCIMRKNDIRFPNQSLNEDFEFVMAYLFGCKSICVLNCVLYNWIRRGYFSGVSSLPDNILYIYKKSYELLLSYFCDELIVMDIMYPTYNLFFYKAYRLFLMHRLSLKELFIWFDVFYRDPYLYRTFKRTSVNNKNEKIIHYLITKRKWILLILLFKLFRVR